jgi:hypothetical protein
MLTNLSDDLPNSYISSLEMTWFREKNLSTERKKEGSSFVADCGLLDCEAV